MPELLRGLAITTRHFLRNLFGARDTNIQVVGPEGHEPRLHGAATRRRRSLPARATAACTGWCPRDDGKPRCVACYMCATICPAQCIYIEAGEYETGDPAAEIAGDREVPDAVRHRRAALHRLRAVRGRVPQGRHPDGHRACTLPSEYNRAGLRLGHPEAAPGAAGEPPFGPLEQAAGLRARRSTSTSEAHTRIGEGLVPLKLPGGEPHKRTEVTDQPIPVTRFLKD